MGRKKKVVYKELEINPIFEPLFFDNLDDPRYYQVFGGRGSGKSFAVSIAMVKLTYSKYKHKILYLRQTMTSAEDSTIADIRTAIQILRKTDDFYESKGVIHNRKTGATISFKGIRASGTQTAKLKSLSGITTLVIEEAEEVESFAEFSKVDESIRLIGKPLKVILIYNPTSALASWIHKEWFVEGQPNIERFNDTIYLHSTFEDNLENLNPSVVQRYRDLERTNYVYYKNTILAEWTLEVAGRVYAGWGMYDEMEEDGDTWYGMDFGYGGNDDTSVVKITWLDGIYYVEEMFSEHKISIRKTLTKMRKAGISFTGRIYADNAVPELVNQIRDGGFTGIRNAKKGNKDAGIKIITDKHIIMIGNQDTKLYYSYMTWKRDEKGKLPHEPDTLAALRYGINSKKPIKNPGKPVKRRARRTHDGGFL